MNIFNVTMHFPPGTLDIKPGATYKIVKVNGIETKNGSEARSIARRLAIVEVGPMPPKRMIVDLVVNGAPKIDEFV